METSAITSPAEALSATELGAWRGLLRVHASLVKALDAQLEEEHGLPLTSYEVLMYLADSEHGKMRMHDIASSVLLSRSGLTRLVDRLERDGYVERVSCEDDARGAFACITPAGREKLAAARATHFDGIRRVFLSRFSEADLEALAGYWERVLPGVCASCAPSAEARPAA
ncbi:MAG TPA: MarR family transcriptional regulator [Solirubrobacteraceae bacterium]|jgi:DNA-binding MarR family transcriptional regulator|nr:MarR family transcriptional regulator [Solirubrobacteraceae bacterium]